LQISHGVRWEDLVRRVAEVGGKSIRIQAVGDEGWQNTTAALSRMADVDLILVRHTDSTLYQTHGMLHEFGHILNGDEGCAGSAVGSVDPNREQTAESIAHVLAHALYRPEDYEDQRVLG